MNRTGALLLACLASHAAAAPVIQGAVGKFDHKASVTLTGTGFGSKATAAPLAWDDVSGTDIKRTWTDRWPSNNATYNTEYRAAMRSITLPHAHASQYIAGGHGDSAGYNAGYNVTFWKNVTTGTGSYIYASWYQRFDNQWKFGDDNNLKAFAYSICCSPYEMPNNWYIAYSPGTPSSNTSSTGWIINDDGGSLANPDRNGHNAWWDSAVNPMAGQWTKIEVAIKVTNATDGYVKLWENGKVRVNYAGATDKYPGTSRSIGIGGYARIYGTPNNWRYYADAYMDNSLARVVMGNQSTLASSTIIENQIPSAWSGTSVTATVNLGKFSQGQQAYLYVVDSAGAANATGYAITVGGDSTPPAPKVPKPPTGVTVE